MDYFLESFDDKKRFFSAGIFSPIQGKLLGFIMALPNYVEDTDRQPFYSDPEKALINKFQNQLAYISSLAVHPDAMRKGLGTKLITSLLEVCKNWTPKPLALFLHVKYDNTRAMKFYERNGFIQEAFIKEYVL